MMKKYECNECNKPLNRGEAILYNYDGNVFLRGIYAYCYECDGEVCHKEQTLLVNNYEELKFMDILKDQNIVLSKETLEIYNDLDDYQNDIVKSTSKYDQLNYENDLTKAQYYEYVIDGSGGASEVIGIITNKKTNISELDAGDVWDLPEIEDLLEEKKQWWKNYKCEKNLCHADYWLIKARESFYNNDMETFEKQISLSNAYAYGQKN